MTDDQVTDNQTADEIGPVLGRIPSGVFILTAGDGSGRETGMLASWVQQASFDPPQVTVAVNRSRYLNEWLTEDRPVTLNLVGENDGAFLKHFGKGFEPDEEAFDGIDVQRDNGAIVLTAASAHLRGRIRDSLAAGDHEIYLVELAGAGQGPGFDGGKPMVHIRKSGLHY